MSRCRTNSSEFKAKVAMETISGRKAIKEIATEKHPPDPHEPVGTAAVEGCQ